MTDQNADDPGEQKEVVLTPLAVTRRQGFNLQQMMFAVGVCAVLIWVVVVTGAWLLPALVVLAAFLAVGLGVVFAKRKAMQQETLLLSLAIAAERSAPLASAALAFADQYDYFFRERVQQLALMLDDGVPLPQALERARGVLPREAVLLAHAGWDANRLGTALRRAAAGRASRQRNWGPVAARLAYLVAVVLSVQLVVSFLMYFVVPKYEAIFNDFGIRLPAMTVGVIEASHLFVQYGVFTSLGVVAELALLALLPIAFLNLFQFDVALFDALFRRRHAALMLRGLALSVEGGLPVEKGLAGLARNYPSAWARNRLLRVEADARGGLDWLESLRRMGFLRAGEVAALDAATRVGNLAWALNETAEAGERRLGYHLQFWLQLLFPAAVLALGAAVGFMVVAYFAPLVTLIERLAG